MMTRYERLRLAVSNLAAPASEQVAYLDEIFAPITKGKSAEVYGNDELALELDYVFMTADDMIEPGELFEAEREAIRPLDAMLESLSGEQNAGFWRREALFNDPRWSEIRALASRVLESLPIEKRAVGRSA